jgi:ferric-dicitrate binding protein FerR (iron transport regulator)
MSTAEPPRPQRGATAQERGSDANEHEIAFEQASTWTQRLKAGADPRLVLSQADGYPPGIKQFLWVSLLIVYPAWLFLVVLMLLLAWPVQLLAKAGEAVLMLLFWPVRRHHFKHHPEEAAAWREKHGKAG